MRPSYTFSGFDFQDTLSLSWNFVCKQDNIDENDKDLIIKRLGRTPRKESSLLVPTPGSAVTESVKGLPKSS